MAAPKKLTIDELAAQYGYAATFFFSNAELRKLIEQAVREQWAPDKFRAKFMATKWYRTQPASVRTWIELEARDPAEAADRVADQRMLIREMANQLGITFSTARLIALARESLIWGWPERTIREAVSHEFKYQPRGGTGGQAATLESEIRRMAADYGVTVSNSQMGQWIGRALGGVYTEDTLRDFIVDMARSKYAGLAPRLDQGFTVRQIAEPYLQSYSQILETPYDQINLQDKHVQRALQGMSVDGKSPPQAQTVYEFERDLRKDSRWLRTKNAREGMTNAALGIARDWGLVG